MNPQGTDPFVSLFLAAYRKCYHSDLARPLSEAESRHFATEILEKTGLVIGARSIKNYSIYASGDVAGKTENPSTATLDSLARYVLEAPYTNETERKKNESHFPYWFRYKSALAEERVLTGSAGGPAVMKAASVSGASRGESGASRNKNQLLTMAVVFLAISFGAWFFILRKPGALADFTDNFNDVSSGSLAANGWTVKGEDSIYWNRRGEKSGSLSLFTLPGDNWADSAGHQGIRNLLVRAIDADCFSTEIHLDGFFPTHNWQQAGLLLMENGSGSGTSLRVSVAYNDYFGGYARPPEIYLQAIMSDATDPGKPEEIVHLPLFTLQPGQEALVKTNLAHAAIRIEKKGDRFRILYAAGPVANFAFREALTKEIAFHPQAAGLFALQGFVPDTDYIPATFSWFGQRRETCP